MFSTNEIKQSNDGHIVFTTGLGLSDKGVPLRLPALIVPGLEKIREELNEGRSVEYVIYQASDFIIEANRLDEKKAAECSGACVRYLNNFMRRFFPDVAHNVKILAGKDCLIENHDLREVEETLFSVLAGRNGQSGVSQDVKAEAQEAMKIICAYGKNHNGNDVFFRYAAANILLNAGYAKKYPLAKFCDAPPTKVILLGGEKEKPFFTLTSCMAKATDCSYVIEPVLVPVGKIPAYYPCPDGDLLVGETGKAFVPPKRTKMDFKILEDVGASITELAAISSYVPSRSELSPRSGRSVEAYGLFF